MHVLVIFELTLFSAKKIITFDCIEYLKFRFPSRTIISPIIVNYNSNSLEQIKLNTFGGSLYVIKIIMILLESKRGVTIKRRVFRISEVSIEFSNQ